MSRKNIGYQTDELSRKFLYAKHRLELKSIRSTIENRPKYMTHIAKSLHIKQMKDDAFIALNRNNKNQVLLRKINHIQRDSAIAKIYRRAPRREPNLSRLNQTRTEMDLIERSNYSLGCRLMKVKSSVITRRGLGANSGIRCSVSGSAFEVPPWTMQKYSRIVLPQEASMLDRLLRPKISFDLAVRNVRPLGRIVIQLFTEACPDVVLELVRMCTTRNLKVFKFIRIFPMLWIEGELKCNSTTLRTSGFEYDMHIMDHAQGPGVLSFAKCYLAGFTHGLVNFSISFKPLRVLNGERLPFGIVTRGLRVLDCLQDYGTKFGKTKQEIVATGCGMFY